MRKLVVFLLAALLLGVPLAASRQAPQQAAAPAAQSVIADVRAAIAKGDFAGGEAILEKHRATEGTTPQSLEALSWLGRGALAANQLDKAYGYAMKTEELVREALATRKLDEDRWTPIALGASFEVQAQVLGKRNRTSEAIYLLENAKTEFKDTSIVQRLQKNVLLLSLEGKPAPPLEATEYIGEKPPMLASLKGKTVLVFFWAHW
jgi:hypothetical protein